MDYIKIGCNFLYLLLLYSAHTHTTHTHTPHTLTTHTHSHTHTLTTHTHTHSPHTVHFFKCFQVLCLKGRIMKVFIEATNYTKQQYLYFQFKKHIFVSCPFKFGESFIVDVKLMYLSFWGVTRSGCICSINVCLLIFRFIQRYE